MEEREVSPTVDPGLPLLPGPCWRRSDVVDEVPVLDGWGNVVEWLPAMTLKLGLRFQF